MTQQTVDAVTLEESGLSIQEVVPGSADDPFTDHSRTASPTVGIVTPTSTAVEGTVPAQTADGTQVRPAQTPGTTATPSQPVAIPAPVPATPAAEPKTMEERIKELGLDDYIASAVKEATGGALRSQQSSYDKQINTLKDELKASREAAVKAEREQKLTSEDLTDEEKDILRHKYELDDREVRLNEYEEAQDAFFKEMYIAKLVEEKGTFGVTPEDLAPFTEPEEWENVAMQKELAFYRSGATPTPQVPSRTVEATGADAVANASAEVPAGVYAPTDVGGGAPATPPAQLEDGSGMDVLSRNLQALKWESLPIN